MASSIAGPVAQSPRFRRFFATVVVVQGVHVFEHVVQLVQVYAFDVPDDDALGLLGYVFQFNGTEEWLHLAFNVTYFASLLVLLIGVRGLVLSGVMPPWAFFIFTMCGVGLEAWHVVEHIVIISNVIDNNGCPCPGIGDAVLGVTDTQLHFVYNAIAYAATVTPFFYMTATRQHKPSLTQRGASLPTATH